MKLNCILKNMLEDIMYNNNDEQKRNLPPYKGRIPPPPPIRIKMGD